MNYPAWNAKLKRLKDKRVTATGYFQHLEKNYGKWTGLVQDTQVTDEAGDITDCGHMWLQICDEMLKYKIPKNAKIAFSVRVIPRPGDKEYMSLAYPEKITINGVEPELLPQEEKPEMRMERPVIQPTPTTPAAAPAMTAKEFKRAQRILSDLAEFCNPPDSETLRKIFDTYENLIAEVGQDTVFELLADEDTPS